MTSVTTSLSKHGEPDTGLTPQTMEALRDVFRQHGGIERVTLYGSRAMGTHRPGSDIDLTIIGDIEPNELLQIEVELDDLLLPQKIDLSLQRQIDNPDLLAHIDRVGRTVYARSHPRGGANYRGGEL